MTEPTLPTQMQAAALERYGGPEVLALRALPVPVVGDDERLLEVKSAGMGVWDALVPQTFVGGAVRIVDSYNFPASVRMVAALIELEPGAMREIHWHPNTDEWQYYLSGQGRMTVFASSNTSRTYDLQAGEVGAVPFAMGHYVENTGSDTLRFLELFASDHYADVSLTQWLALTPHELVVAHLNVDAALISILPTEKHPVVPGHVVPGQVN